MQPFELEGLKRLLIQQQGGTFLIENRCGHFGVPLDSARFYDQPIECNQHYIRFDLHSGEVAGECRDPYDPLTTFEVVTEGEVVGLIR